MAIVKTIRDQAHTQLERIKDFVNDEQKKLAESLKRPINDAVDKLSQIINQETVSTDLKALVLNAVEKSHLLADKDADLQKAAQAKKLAEEQARIANQRLLDHLKKDSKKSGTRLVQIDEKFYLLNPTTTPGSTVVQMVEVEGGV